MDAFVWDQSFITGLPGVDEQHHKMVDLFNELHNSVFATDAERDLKLQDAFNRVIDYTHYHFQDEEALMLAEGVDRRHIEMHIALHKQFVIQIKANWERRQSAVESTESFATFLTSWLGLHILGIDQSLARQIQLIHRGVSAADAFDSEVDGSDKGIHAVLKLVGNLYHVLSLQNSELMHSNANLEERVAQRTLELAQANAELIQANVQLEKFSRIDGLLQISNRKYFDQRLVEASASAFRRKSPLGLLMIDVDFFKRYNDTYGHQAGDVCLQSVAKAVQKATIRETDLVARYGGEELVVILPDTDLAGSQAVAARVVAEVAGMGLAHKKSDAAPYVTVSIGVISQIPAVKDASAILLSGADAALYKAKESGRNRWVVAS